MKKHTLHLKHVPKWERDAISERHKFCRRRQQQKIDHILRLSDATIR
jgi:hypothetical protein